MRILALETSCDETACAIVEDGWKVHANVIASSLDLHKITGGVVPEIAARAQIESIIPVIKQTLEQSGFDHADLDAIAVTTEPGLVTSLLVGTETAKWLGYLWNKPVISVNHIHGHVYANWLERDPATDPIVFPIISLSVSGGHNELILLKNHQEWEVIGESQDDAAGEAFDKVARILGLGYPGGPEIEQHASKFVRTENVLKMPRAWLNTNPGHHGDWDQKNFDFSFSGLKSEVLREVQRRGELTDQDRIEISHAFQEAVFDVLVTKLLGAAKIHQAKEIHIAGGVSANKRLQEIVGARLGAFVPEVKFRWPEKMVYCTDNASMIAAAGYFA